MPERNRARPLLVVLRALGLGDFLTAVPALRALAEAFPEHHRVLAAPAALAPLAQLAGATDEVVNTGPLEPLSPALHRADVAVNLHGSGPESHAVLLRARPRRMIAFRNPQVPESSDGPYWRADEHEVARWCRLLRSAGIPARPDRLDLPAPPLPVPGAARGATLIHPGAASGARRWPAERWSRVALAESQAGRPVILTGGPSEAGLALRVARGAKLPEGCVYAGRTDLLELAALVAAAGRVVCGDTGVAHLATALRTPSVVLFGPVPPALWGPPEHPQHRILWSGTAGDPHAESPDAGLLKISVGDVLRELARLPESSAVHHSARGPAR